MVQRSLFFCDVTVLCGAHPRRTEMRPELLYVRKPSIHTIQEGHAVHVKEVWES